MSYSYDAGAGSLIPSRAFRTERLVTEDAGILLRSSQLPPDWMDSDSSGAVATLSALATFFFFFFFFIIIVLFIYLGSIIRSHFRLPAIEASAIPLDFNQCQLHFIRISFHVRTESTGFWSRFRAELAHLNVDFNQYPADSGGFLFQIRSELASFNVLSTGFQLQQLNFHRYQRGFQSNLSIFESIWKSMSISNKYRLDFNQSATWIGHFGTQMMILNVKKAQRWL